MRRSNINAIKDNITDKNIRNASGAKLELRLRKHILITKCKLKTEIETKSC